MGEAAQHPPVRLTPEELAAVRRIVAAHFGPEAEVRVFGSRARLDVRGGDLDLIVQVPGERPPFSAEAAAAWDLEPALDGLAVDLVVVSRRDTPSLFERNSWASGVRL